MTVEVSLRGIARLLFLLASLQALACTKPRDASVAAAKTALSPPPTVQPEFGIDTPLYGPDGQTQMSPAVAFDGTQYFVVWSDLRTGTDYDVYGARVALDGTVLDLGGLPLATGVGHQWVPSVAWNGSSFLVAYTDQSQIAGVRVAPDGTILAPGRIALSNGTGACSSASVASFGANFFVAWTRSTTSSAYDVQGTPVGSDGVPSHPEGLTLGSAANSQQDSRLVATSTGYVVLWRDSRAQQSEIYGNVVAPDGTVADVAGKSLIPGADYYWGPVLSEGGGNELVCAMHQNASSQRSIECRLFTPDLSSGTAVVTVAPAPADWADVVFDGNRFVVFHDVGSAGGGGIDIYARGVGIDGVPQGTASTPIVALATNAAGPRAVFDGTRFFVAEVDSRLGTDGEIFGVVVQTDLSVTSAAPVSMEALREEHVDVALGDHGYLAIFEQQVSGQRDIHGSRIGLDGTVLDTTSLVVSAVAGNEMVPRVAYGAGVYLAAWMHPGSSFDVHGMRIAEDGTLLDPPGGFVIASATNNQEFPDVAWNGSEFLVTWDDYRNNRYDVYAARVTPDGVVQDASGFLVETDPNSSERPTVASDGTGFLVAWTSDNHDRILAARVDASGTVLDTTPKLLSPIGTSNTAEGPRVAFGGGSYVVIWQDGSMPGYRIVRANGVLPTGAVATPQGYPVATEGTILVDPAVGFGGSSFLAAWASYNSTTLDYDLFARRFAADGTLLDATPLTISQTPALERMPSITSPLGERWLLGYQRLDRSPGFGNVRARLRFVDGSVACSQPSDCASGFCVDGVCCDQACGGGAVDCQACSVAAGGTSDGTCTPLRAMNATSTICRAAAGPCDVAETCASTSTTCPADAFYGPTKVCRGATDVCDAAESCDGLSPDCPPDAFSSTTVVCRAASGVCDFEEHCTGANPACPLDGFAPDGTACSDALTCNGLETCASGTCQAAAPLACDDGNACTGDLCQEPTGCSHVPIAGCCLDASTCDDGNVCTADACSANACTHDPIAGCCLDATTCDDGNACTADACSANACTHDPIAGCCLDASTCDDGNVCTADACSANACTHDAIAGCCLDATTCDDGNVCTADACSANACTHDAIAGCCLDASMCDDGDACTVDTCEVNGCSHAPSNDAACAPPSPPSKHESGCACSAAGAARPASPAFHAAGLLLALGLRFRRRSRRR